MFSLWIQRTFWGFLIVFLSGGSWSLLIHAESVAHLEEKPLWKMIPLDPIFDASNVTPILDMKVSSDRLTSWFLTHQGLWTWDGDQLRNVSSSSWPNIHLGSEMTWSETEVKGGWMVASGHRVWRVESDLNMDNSVGNQPPDLPSGFRCVELVHDDFGSYWARSPEAIYTWNPHYQSDSSDWRKIPGAPQRFDLPVGDSPTMQTDLSGDLWVTGYHGSEVGLWTLRKSSERWVEISIPESRNLNQVPLLARQQNTVSDPVVVWGNCVGVVENGAWEKLGTGVWDMPILAAWVDSSSEKQLWLWDQSDGALKLWLPDSNETFTVSLVDVGKGDEPEFLMGATGRNGVWIGWGGRVTHVEFVNHGRFDWGNSGIHLNPETADYSSTPGRWLVLSSDRKSVYEVRWKDKDDLSPGKVELLKVFGLNNQIGTDAKQAQQSSSSFQLNSLMVESDRIWLATSHGIWRLKQPSSTQLQQFHSDLAQKQPPLPTPVQSSPLFQPSYLSNEANSPLDKSPVRKIGRIPGAGLWALMEDGSLYWIWTSEESETPSWIQSKAPWKFTDPNVQIIAVSTTEALVWNHGVWVLVESRYRFVNQNWTWNREFLSRELDQNPAPISWRLNPDQTLWSHSQGWTSFQTTSGQLHHRRWEGVEFEDRIRDVAVLGGSYEKIAGWMLRDSGFWEFGANGLALVGSGLAGWADVNRILEWSRFGEDSSHVFLLGPENLIAWPTRNAKKLKATSASPVQKLRSRSPSTSALELADKAIESLLYSQPTKLPASESSTRQSPDREDSEWILYVLGWVGIAFLVLGLGPLRHQFLTLSRGGKGIRSFLLEAKKRKSAASMKSDSLAVATTTTTTTITDVPDDISLHDDLYWQSLGHELRTPLNAILGYAELLAEDLEAGVSESVQEDLKRITSAARRELTLVRAFVDYSSSNLTSTGNRQPANYDHYRPLVESVTMALRHVQPLAASKRCEIIPSLLEPLNNGKCAGNGNGSTHSGSKVSPETVRALEYFLEAGVHMNPGGCLKWELVESTPVSQHPDQNGAIIPGAASFTLKIWCKTWPETVDSITNWLDGKELWRQIFVNEEAGLKNLKNHAMRQSLKQDAPLWKVCLALSDLLARGQCGKLVCRVNGGIPNSAFGEEVQLVFASAPRSNRTQLD